MKKIAVTGAKAKDRLVLTQALHYLTGYDIVRHTAYSSQAIRYGLNEKLTECNWQELYIYVFSSFSERIEIEQQYDKFISNGSVFNELADMEGILKSHSSNRKNKEQLFMLSGMKKIISEYANRKYDCIIHISDALENENQLTVDVDNYLMDLIKNTKTKYFIKKDSALVDVLDTISTDMKFPSIISSKTAWEKAQRDVLNKI